MGSSGQCRSRRRAMRGSGVLAWTALRGTIGRDAHTGRRGVTKRARCGSTRRKAEAGAALRAAAPWMAAANSSELGQRALQGAKS
jgi:hypothetical protein